MFRRKSRTPLNIHTIFQQNLDRILWGTTTSPRAIHIGLPLPDDQWVFQKTDEKGKDLGVEKYFLNLSATSNFCSEIGKWKELPWKTHTFPTPDCKPCLQKVGVNYVYAAPGTIGQGATVTSRGLCTQQVSYLNNHLNWALPLASLAQRTGRGGGRGTRSHPGHRYLLRHKTPKCQRQSNPKCTAS